MRNKAPAELFTFRMDWYSIRLWQTTAKVLNISGREISRIRIDVTFKTEIVKPIIKSKYEIEGRGRIVTVGYSIPGQKELILNIIEKDASK